MPKKMLAFSLRLAWSVVAGSRQARFTDGHHDRGTAHNPPGRKGTRNQMLKALPTVEDVGIVTACYDGSIIHPLSHSKPPELQP